MKTILNIEKQRELLSTGNKKFWDETRKDLDVVAKELGLDANQKEALVQVVMAAIRTGDLNAEIKYLSKNDPKSKDILAQKAIKRDTLDLQQMKHVYEDNYQVIKDFEQQANLKLTELREKREKSNNKKTNN